MRNRISRERWEAAKTAYASGTGLRELARSMKIPEGTVLARANREGWTQQIATAKVAARPELARELAQPDAINAITPLQSAATIMVQRGQRYTERMATRCESVVPYLEKMKPEKFIADIHEIKKFDDMTRRTFGLNDSSGLGGSLSIAVLTNQAAVVVTAQA